MATIRAYTTIEQSRKLAEILPLESADMCYKYYSGGMITGYGDCVFAKSFITGKNVIRENDLPCWSLAALLYVLPDKTCVYKKTYKDGRVKYQGVAEGIKDLILKDNPVDACYEMIIKLHELKML